MTDEGLWRNEVWVKILELQKKMDAIMERLQRFETNKTTADIKFKRGKDESQVAAQSRG